MSVAQPMRSRTTGEVETNGTIQPQVGLIELVHRCVVSPKLANAGLRNVCDVSQIARFAPLKSVLKFVVEVEEDVLEAARLAKQAGFSEDRVWVMPEGTDWISIALRMGRIAPQAIECGVSISPRLHIGIWGDVRRR